MSLLLSSDVLLFMVDVGLEASKAFELLLPFTCLSITFVTPLAGAGVFAAEDAGDEDDELVVAGGVSLSFFDSFFSFSFFTLGLNSVITTVKSLTVTL